MKTVFKPDLKSKTFSICKNYNLQKEKEISSVGFKFYQKVFIVMVSLFTILIFSESPRELENICESYNSRKSCIVW